MTGALIAREWLNRPSAVGEVTPVMEQLWSHVGLRRVADKSVACGGRADHSVFAVAFDRARRARIQLALRELKELVHRHRCGVVVDDQYLNEVLMRRALPELDGDDQPGPRHEPASTHRCWSHGDLHVGNVIIDTDLRRARLIDPATIEDLPWPMDFARLMVSILMECWDQGWASHEWDGVGRWIEIARGMIQGPHITTDTTNQTAAAALSWLRGHLGQIYRNIPARDVEWQFRVALAAEFLRASYRSRLSAPKRVLGLLAGSEALRATVEAFRSRDELPVASGGSIAERA